MEPKCAPAHNQTRYSRRFPILRSIQFRSFMHARAYIIIIIIICSNNNNNEKTNEQENKKRERRLSYPELFDVYYRFKRFECFSSLGSVVCDCCTIFIYLSSGIRLSLFFPYDRFLCLSLDWACLLRIVFFSRFSPCLF